MSLANDATITMPVAPAYQCGNGYGNNSMWGGDWASWIILFLIFGMFGWCGFGGFGGGWGNNGGNGLGSPSGQGWATRADINEGFALNNLQSGINSIQNGICDSTYTLSNAINNGFHGVDSAVCQLGYQTQQSFNTLGAQIADCCCTTQRSIDNAMFQTTQAVNGVGSKIDACCCETQRQIERGFCDTNYNMATNTTSIIQNAHNDADRVIAKLDAMENARQQERIAALQAENQSLKFAASQVSQNAYLTATMDANQAELIRRLGRDCPVPAYVVPNPNCCYGTPVGVMNNGCGCGTCA